MDSFVIGFQFWTKMGESHQLSLSFQPLMELIISSPAHIPIKWGCRKERKHRHISWIRLLL